MKLNEPININVLFVGGGKRVSLAQRFIAAGKKFHCEVNIKIFSYELSDIVPISDISTVIIGLKFKDQNIKQHLIKTIKDFKINIVIPLMDEAIPICASIKSDVKNILILSSDQNISTIMYDKCLANQWFVENGFDVPDNKKFPLILKPKFGFGSKGIQIVNSLEQLNLIQNKSNFLIQEYIDGIQYTVDAYVDIYKNILGVVPRKRIQVVGGEVSISMTIEHQRICNISKQIIQKANLMGPITIQFIQSISSLYIMEVNPRFGGGVINSIEAGFDIPYLILRDYLGISNIPIQNVKYNLIMTRANREFFICK